MSRDLSPATMRSAARTEEKPGNRTLGAMRSAARTEEKPGNRTLLGDESVRSAD